MARTDNIEIMNRSQLHHKIANLDVYKPDRAKALLSLMYLTGCRISELIRAVKRSQFEREKYKGQEAIVIYNMPILKRRAGNEARRNVPMLIGTDMNFLKFIIPYVSSIPMDQPVFKISRMHAHRIVKKTIGDDFYCHYFRHLRATHLTTLYGFNSAELRAFFGWSNDAPASKYTHLNWHNVMDKMLNTSQA